MTTPWKTLTIAALALVVVTALSAGLIAHRLSGDVTSLRQQMTAAQARDHAATARAQALLAAAQARLSGGHRDLVTCGDLQALITDMPQSDSNGDTVFYGGPSGNLPLPAHCLNQ